MAMLSPHEISAGNLKGAAALGLTLVVPRNDYEERILVAGIPDQKNAVFLSGQFRFEAFECSSNDALEGMLIRDLAIELDDTSLYDPSANAGATLGSLVRESTFLNIVATVRDGSHGFRRTKRVALMADLPECSEREAAAFDRWQIVAGKGDDKRELFVVDVRAP